MSNASSEFFPHNTLSSFNNFLQEQVILDGPCEVAVSEIYLQNTGILPRDENLSETENFYYCEPGLHPSITDVVEAMNSLIQNRNNHNDNCLRVKVSRRSRKVGVSLVNKESSLVISGHDLGQIFGGDVRKNMGFLMRGKGPRKPLFAYDIVRVHSLMIITDNVEYNMVWDTQALLLRCFSSISKLKSGDTITTRQYMNYQTFSNLQFRRLLKNFFLSIQIHLRDTSGDKFPLVSVRITRLVFV